MLNSIVINNIVLIDRLQIQFKNYNQPTNQTVNQDKIAIKNHNNFCVLTGETGSGKSILLDALGLAIGYRSNSRLLKQGEKNGLVVAEFDIGNNKTCQNILQENGLLNPENDNLLILRRILLENGSKAFVNDITVGVNLLAKIGQSLIEIHGQNDQNNLLDPSFHLVVLDNFANNKILLEEINQCFVNLENTKKELQKIDDEREKNQREKDYLIYIIKELKTADVQLGEEEILTQKRNLILNQEKVNDLLNQVLEQINQGDNSISLALRLLTKNQNLANFIINGEIKLENLINILDEILVKNDQAKALIDSVFDSFDNKNLKIDEIEERLFLVRSLARKFNINVDNLPEFLEKSQQKLQLLENFTIASQNLEKQKIDLEKEFLQKAEKLSQIRQKAALELTEKVEKELKFLKMDAVKFVVKIEKLEERNFNKDGIDKVRFLSATNASTNLDEINKIASGGELSRFMLALKVALLEVASTPILIFDEIDSGIGGAVANAVGERLKLLSQNLQVLVVTHHPQIAAKASFHLKVQKITQNQITKTEIAVLSLDERQKEVARMLAAEELTQEAMAAAKKLME